MEKKNLLDILGRPSKKEKFEFHKAVFHLDFMGIIQKKMRYMRKKELAKALNVSPAYVTKLFTGDKLINLDTIVKFQNIFNVKFKIVEKIKDTEKVETPQNVINVMILKTDSADNIHVSKKSKALTPSLS